MTRNNGQVHAEIVANADTREVMVQARDQDLKNSESIEDNTSIIGSGDQMIELEPQPIASDPSGFCSRFCGQADWLREGQMRQVWLTGGADQARHKFSRNNG